MEYNDFEEENDCEGCMHFDYQEDCYSRREACKICIRNPYACFDDIDEERTRVFINKGFLIEPPEDMYLPRVNPDPNSIAFIAVYGLPPKKTEKLNPN